MPKSHERACKHMSFRTKVALDHSDFLCLQRFKTVGVFLCFPKWFEEVEEKGMYYHHSVGCGLLKYQAFGIIHVVW